MHKFYLFLLPILFSYAANAQCTPDPQYTSPGNFPDSLKISWIDSTYSAVITNVVPLDTTISVAGVPTAVTVNFVKVIKFLGLPSDFSVAFNPSDSTFVGGTSGCILISSSLITSPVGIYPLEIHTNTEGVASVLGFPITQNQLDTVRSYFIEIKDGAATGGGGGTGGTTSVETHKIDSNKDIDLLKTYPSPANNETTVSFYMKNNEQVRLSVINMIGEIVFQKNINASKGIYQDNLNVSDFKTGIYFLSVKTKSGITSTQKFSVVH